MKRSFDRKERYVISNLLKLGLILSDYKFYANCSVFYFKYKNLDIKADYYYSAAGFKKRVGYNIFKW